MRRLLPLLAGAAALLPAAPAPAAWTPEPVPSTDVLQPLDLAFDGQGRALATWEGFAQPSRKFTGVDVRAADGTWTRGADLAGITWGRARVHLYGSTHALLVSAQTARLGAFNRAVFRLVYAYGRSDGTFGPLRTLAEETTQQVSAANGKGQALVAWRDRRTGVTRVRERPAGGSFGATRQLGDSGTNAAAVGEGGDRVLAWWGKDGLMARVRRPGHGWGSALLAVRTPAVANAQVRALVAPGGRVVLAWESADVREGRATPVRAGVALRDRTGGWRRFALESGTTPAAFDPEASAKPVLDAQGRLAVAYTGVVDEVATARVARVTSSGVRVRVTLGQGQVQDAAAASGGALAVAWTARDAQRTVVWVSLRRPGAPAFDSPAALTSPDGAGFGTARVAFGPDGRALVVWTEQRDGHGVLAAASGP
ncbi:MAG: hypothetical protein HZB46_11325 [Solirubrobacterales bacterium]|nr:hypothetical protein [Solirubrobacterales bacterium]